MRLEKKEFFIDEMKQCREIIRNLKFLKDNKIKKILVKHYANIFYSNYNNCLYCSKYQSV